MILIDDTMEVYVSAIETPGQFWVQILGPGITYLESLTGQMSLYYDDKDNHPMHTLKEVCEKIYISNTFTNI